MRCEIEGKAKVGRSDKRKEEIVRVSLSCSCAVRVLYYQCERSDSLKAYQRDKNRLVGIEVDQLEFPSR